MNIVVKDVTKYIRGSLILDHVNLSLSSGHIYGLQGPNGSGKTMLMRLIGGLIRSTSGSVWIDGKELGKGQDFPPSVGLLIENPGFLPGYTGLQNLQLLASIRETATAAQLRQTLFDVGLDPDDRRKYRKYSLGMKQRLGVAAAIMEQPDLILMDEPTNALDEEGTAQICKLLEQQRDKGALIILACHDRAVLERLSDEIYRIYEGKVERKML